MASKAPLLSEVARSALSLAVAEAMRHGQAVAGTDHLLLGICQMAEGGAAAILESLGVPRDHPSLQRKPFQEGYASGDLLALPSRGLLAYHRPRLVPRL